MSKPNNTTLSINIHGMYVEDALKTLREFVAKAPCTTEKIIVVHGYNNGTALRDAVRYRLHASRIQEIAPSFYNDGESILWLRKGQQPNKHK